MSSSYICGPRATGAVSVPYGRFPPLILGRGPVPSPPRYLIGLRGSFTSASAGGQNRPRRAAKSTSRGPGGALELDDRDGAHRARRSGVEDDGVGRDLES